MKITLLSIFFLLCKNIYAQSFEKLADFPGERRDDAVAVYQDGFIYAGTGFTSSFYPLRDWWRYDIDQQSWEQLPDIPFDARQYVAAEVSGKYIYLLGGVNNSSLFFNDFWRYDIEGKVWNRLADLPGTGRWAAKLVSVKRELYAGLGNDTSAFFRDWYKYDTLDNRWIRKADFPGGGLSKGISGNFGNSILVGLGRDEDTFYNTFWQYFPETDNWKKIPFELPEKLTYSAAALIGHTLYIMGGQRKDNSYSSLFYQIDLLKSSYSSVEAPVNTRRGGNMVSSGVELYLLWGLNNSSQRINDFYKVSLPADAVQWIEIFPNPVTDVLKVKFPEGSKRVEVYFDNGQLYKTYTSGNENFMFIQAANFPAQCYFIRICNENDCSAAMQVCKLE